MTALRSGSATDVGRVRTSNQDVALEDPDLFAVADGMGGHVGGEVAARLAIDTLRSSFQRQPSVEGLRRAVAEANRAVWRQSSTEPGLRGMGTTLTATALVQDTDGRQLIALANVGDSRAYVFSNGKVTQVTADHSLAEEKVRQGEMTEEEAAVHPHRHILTRALGVASDVDVDLWELHLQEGDRILLCSDGLTNEVDDELIGEMLATEGDPRRAAQGLVRAAIAHGGNDNVTVVIVDVATGDAGAERGDGAPAVELAAVAGATLLDGAAGADGAEAGDDTAGTGNAGAAGAPTAASAPAVAAAALTGDLLVAERPGAGFSSGRDYEDHGLRSAFGLSEPDGESSRRRPTRRERRKQRRMAGIPRLITIRSVLFVVLVAAVVVAAYVLVKWYAMDDWYVTLHDQHLSVYQGRPGGFLWFKPKLVDETSVTARGILALKLPTVRSDRQEPSLAAAKHYITNLHQEFVAVQQLGTGVTPNASSTTTTTAPPATTTTVPPASAGTPG